MSLYGALAESDREGKEVSCGESAVTASVEITTPFADIDAVLITHKSGSAPGVGSAHFTYSVSGNVVTIYAWKVTASGDATLIAGTVETNVSYAIIGRRRS